MKHLREKHEVAELQKMVKSVSIYLFSIMFIRSENYLKTLMPRHCGRPPNKVGASAGGNLTSDQLRSLITIHFPLAVGPLGNKLR
jgi:hypothetical protein